jgi:hypothetical protein
LNLGAARGCTTGGEQLPGVPDHRHIIAKIYANFIAMWR